MPKTVYKNYNELSAQQEIIMQFIIEWVRTKKTPVPKKEIILAMKEQKIGYEAVDSALAILLVKGYVRRAYTEKQNTTAYVQLRGL